MQPMKKSTRLPSSAWPLLALILGVVLGACTSAQVGVEPLEVPQPAIAQPETVSEVVAAPEPKPAEPADLYDFTVEPLTLAECARCHTSHFQNLKDQGGKHRFDCKDCHQVIHAYNPLRNNYQQLMPQCSSCHTEPHGSKHVACLSCHANPHTPLSVAYAGNIKPFCADCHAGPSGQLAQYPSKHTEQECASCHHQKHGYIPNCSECHTPHYAEQPQQACAQCHPVHSPLQIAFTPDTAAKTCLECHAEVYGMWSKSPSKHRGVNCSQCHAEHGLIPQCSSCHGLPHSESFHAKYPRCLSCHLNAHDPPVKVKM